MDGRSDQLLRTTEVAALLGIGERSLARLVSAGHFPKPTKVGNSLRFSRLAVQAWLASQSSGGAK
jgi:excisionase family DNA binding protein